MASKRASLAYLNECLDYDADSGILSWKRTRPDYHFKTQARKKWWTVRYGGREITCIANNGYIVFNLLKVLYLAHRVCFAIANQIEMDDLPEQIDHKDTCKTNNRAENFRAADAMKNGWNTSLSKNSTSGLKGVSWGKQRGMWRSTISINKKHTHLGFFNTKEDAHAAYVAAANDNFGEFARAA